MPRLDALKGLLILIAVLLALNLAVQRNRSGNSAIPIATPAFAETSLPLQFQPVRPQWLVTASPDGTVIYVWKYDGTTYVCDAYQFALK